MLIKLADVCFAPRKVGMTFSAAAKKWLTSSAIIMFKEFNQFWMNLKYKLTKICNSISQAKKQIG